MDIGIVEQEAENYIHEAKSIQLKFTEHVLVS